MDECTERSSVKDVAGTDGAALHTFSNWFSTVNKRWRNLHFVLSLNRVD